MNCSSCGSNRVRTSRLRLPDLLQLLLFKYPVRCHNCFERCYVSLLVARKLYKAQRTRRGESQRKHATLAGKADPNLPE